MEEGATCALGGPQEVKSVSVKQPLKRDAQQIAFRGLARAAVIVIFFYKL